MFLYPGAIWEADMARAYGIDLRRRVIEAIDGGMSARAAAVRFSIGVATAIVWHRKWRKTGSLEPGRQGHPQRSRLDPYEAFIIALIEGQADIALHEIVERLEHDQGLRISKTSLWKFLHTRGWTYKKRPLTQQNRSGLMSAHDARPGSTRSRIWTRTG